MTVLFFLAHGFEETELVTPVDILRRAGADAKLVSIEDTLLVEGSHGIKIEADIYVRDIKDMDFDAIVFPGGLKGTQRLSESVWTEKFLKIAIEKGAYIGAICAAPTILAKFGYLEGKNFTCYPGMEYDIEDGIYCQSGVVHDDVFITAEAMGSSAEFGFKLAEIIRGKDAAETVKENICYRQN
jgi:4-methyl-5(b-hydroxyethyl)-thiazole monophosphate biosynthesis